MTETVVELVGCSYRYDTDIPALRGIDCAIPAGTWVALIGQNGSGKSTMAKLCNGLLRPQEGKVYVSGRDIADQSVSEIAGSVGFLFQNPDHQIFAPSVREELAFGLRNLGFSAAVIAERVEETLSHFGLESYIDQPPAMLGYGLRRLVTVASVFALRPPTLILDEPTVGLDRGVSQRLLDRLSELHRRGHTVILITHDMRLVAERAEWILVLHQGRLLTQGPVHQVFAEPGTLLQASLSPPPVTCLAQRLRHLGMRGDSLTVEEFHREYSALRSGMIR